MSTLDTVSLVGYGQFYSGLNNSFRVECGYIYANVLRYEEHNPPV